MKLPNNFGTVSKMSGNRRNPWRARKLERYEICSDGRLRGVYINVGYYPTRAEAIAGLALYNQTHTDYAPDISGMTLQDIYDKWSARKYPKASKALLSYYQTGWRCTPPELMRTPIVKISLRHLQDVVDNSGRTEAMLRHWKLLMGQLYEYAVMYDIIPPERNKVRYIDLSTAAASTSKPHERLSQKEIDILWQQPDSLYRDAVLMMIYCGCRPSELLRVQGSDVDLSTKTFRITKSKTAAGIRTVPIADKTYELWERYTKASRGGRLLPIAKSSEITDNFPIPGHTGYDCRHTCISLLAEAGVDERIIQQIVGHKGQTITRSVYTHFDMKPLRDAINLI